MQLSVKVSGVPPPRPCRKRELLLTSLVSAGAPDRNNDPHAVHESDQVTEKPQQGEQRHAEQGWALRHRHNDGGADHERCRHDADGCPIHRAVEATTEAIEALEVEIDPQATV